MKNDDDMVWKWKWFYENQQIVSQDVELGKTPGELYRVDKDEIFMAAQQKGEEWFLKRSYSW